MTTTSTEARKASLFARTATATLVQSALMLEAKTDATTEERLTASWIYDEIETRCGGVQDEDKFMAFYDDLDSYTAALMAYFPELRRVSVLCRLNRHRWRWVYDLHIAEGQSNPPGHWVCTRCWETRE